MTDREPARLATCEACAWRRATTDGLTRRELNRAMIDHHVETGHGPIEAVRLEGDRNPDVRESGTEIRFDEEQGTATDRTDRPTDRRG